MISFQIHENVLAILSCLGTASPVLVSEQNDPELYPPTGWTWVLLRRLLYPLASCVILFRRSLMRGLLW